MLFISFSSKFLQVLHRYAPIPTWCFFLKTHDVTHHNHHHQVTMMIWILFLALLVPLHMVYGFVSIKGPKRVHSQLFMRDVTVKNLDNNNEIVIASGQPLSLAAVRSDMRLSFQCKQGTCQSCQVLLNGMYQLLNHEPTR